MSLSILSPALFAGRFDLGAKVAYSPMSGLSVSGVAAAVDGQEDEVLHSSLLPLTIVTPQPTETPAPLPQQSPVPEMPAESIMAAAGVASARTQPTPPSPPPVYIVYTVQDGDTVEGLAASYGISASSMLWSNLDLESADSLVPGQYLRVPTSDGIVYDVRLGDTLSDIAARFGVDVQAIIDFPGNSLNSADSIAENQTIFVPNGIMPAPAVTPTPAPQPQPESPSTPAPVPLPTPLAVSPSGIGAQAVELARSRIGAPYVSGAAGPNGFDCSGLVYWVYSQLGLGVPRSTEQQMVWAAPVEPSELQPGDLVFFENTSSSSDRISHVGIYVGGGGVVMAVNNGDIVREVSLAESYWTAHFAGAGRPP